MFDPCWLDQTPRWSCDDVARRPRTPPVAPQSFGNPLRIAPRETSGTEGSNLSPSSEESAANLNEVPSRFVLEFD
jgi:hypothetical protein